MTLAIIQARAGGERLPGKVMLPLAGVPMIDHVIARTRAAELVDEVVVAVPSSGDNDELAEHVRGLGVDVHRGSEFDVLARFYWAAQGYPDADPIVRITADDPFKDPALIDHAIRGFLVAQREPDPVVGAPNYLHLGGPTWPLGLDVEVFTRETLTAAQTNARDLYEREHVTPWMAKNVATWRLNDDLARGSDVYRWTVDEASDYSLACWIYDKLYSEDPLFGYDRILDLLFDK